MRKKVELVTFAASWDWQGKKNHNFVIKFTDAKEDGDKRYVYVSQENPQTKFVVGQEVDFELSKDKDGKQKTIKGTIGGKSFEYERIDLIKQSSGFGGGGGKNYNKTPDQYKNELLGYIGGYAKDIISHRTTLGKDADDIIAVYEKLVDGMFKALSKHIK